MPICECFRGVAAAAERDAICTSVAPMDVISCARSSMESGARDPPGLRLSGVTDRAAAPLVKPYPIPKGEGEGARCQSAGELAARYGVGSLAHASPQSVRGKDLSVFDSSLLHSHWTIHRLGPGAEDDSLLGQLVDTQQHAAARVVAALKLRCRQDTRSARLLEPQLVRDVRAHG
jgi:hypothetical protein